jgi:hypothetical protein
MIVPLFKIDCLCESDCAARLDATVLAPWREPAPGAPQFERIVAARWVEWSFRPAPFSCSTNGHGFHVIRSAAARPACAARVPVGLAPAWTPKGERVLRAPDGADWLACSVYHLAREGERGFALVDVSPSFADELLAEIGAAEEYAPDELVPLPAICTGKKCGREYVAGKDGPVMAPSLDNCHCWCGARLKPHPDYPGVVDARRRRELARIADELRPAALAANAGVFAALEAEERAEAEAVSGESPEPPGGWQPAYGRFEGPPRPAFGGHYTVAGTGRYYAIKSGPYPDYRCTDPEPRRPADGAGRAGELGRPGGAAGDPAGGAVAAADRGVPDGGPGRAAGPAGGPDRPGRPDAVVAGAAGELTAEPGFLF